MEVDGHSIKSTSILLASRTSTTKTVIKRLQYFLLLQISVLARWAAMETSPVEG